MEPVYLSIQQEATGKRMRQLIREKGYSVRDIQEAMGFESPQAVYKWLSGKCLPNLDNFLILSRILHTSMEDILVVDGDIAVFRNEVRQMKSVWNREDFYWARIDGQLYWEEEKKPETYRDECKDKAFEMFSKWFWHLWD